MYVAKDLYSSTHATLKRLTEIHRRLLPPGQLPTAAILAEFFGVSRKTIQRDVKFMREVWGAPIRYNASLGGYEYFEGVIDFPAIKLTEEEVFAFLVARNSIERYQGAAIREPLSSIYDKFIAQMGVLSSKRMERIREYVSFRTAGWSTLSYKVLDRLSKACRDRRLVSFNYNYPWRGEERKGAMRPLHLVNHENAWYVLTWGDNEGVYPMYSLARMKRLRVYQSTFPEHDFSLEKYMKDSFGIFRGNELHKVRVRFDAFAAPFVKERKWNASQRIKNRKDGGIEFSITVNHLVELKGWILNWGEHAKVLSPKELVEDVKAELKKTLALY